MGLKYISTKNFNDLDANMNLFDFLAKQVDYKPDWNPLDNLINLYLENDAYNTYFLNKDILWQHEQELRVVAQISGHPMRTFDWFTQIQK